MSEEGNCPFCGAERIEPTCYDDVAYMYEEKFDCGFDANTEIRTHECKDRQISQQAQEIADKDKRLDFEKRISESLKAQLKYADERLEAWRDFYKFLFRWATHDFWSGAEECIKLKDLGEI